MTQLATREQNGSAVATRGGAAVAQVFSVEDIEVMARRLVESKLFAGIDTVQKAFTLMMLCQADGLHPIQVVRRYDIIQGRPAMKSSAIQAEFQARGGLIEIVELTDKIARARFSHPRLQPKPIEMSYTWEQATKAKLTGKDPWLQNPQDMLWWRLVSKTVRKIDPGIVAGVYSSEEVEDMGPLPPIEARATAIPTTGEAPLLGQTTAIDDRPYHEVVAQAVDELNRFCLAAAADHLGENQKVIARQDPLDVHRLLMDAAIQMGYAEGPRPKKAAEAISRLAAVYKAERAWVRDTLREFLDAAQSGVDQAIDDALAAKADAEPEAAAEAVAAGREPGEDG